MFTAKRGRIAVLTALCLLVSNVVSSSALKAQALPDNRIRVTGSGELVASADRAELNFLIEGLGSNLERAVIQAQGRISVIKDSLTRVGVPVEAISVARFSAGENWFDRSSWSSKKDYRAAIGVTVVLDDLALLQPVLYLLSDWKIESMSDIAFSIKDDMALKRRARALALENAARKADEMTAHVGAKVVRVTGIEELPSLAGRSPVYPMSRFSNPFNFSMSDRSSGITTIGEAGSGIALPGDVVINVAVAVTYEFQPSSSDSSASH